MENRAKRAEDKENMMKMKYETEVDRLNRDREMLLDKIKFLEKEAPKYQQVYHAQAPWDQTFSEENTQRKNLAALRLSYVLSLADLKNKFHVLLKIS
jgi:hypothetical protein